MEFTNLATFIENAKARGVPTNDWIKEPGFNGIYVRYTKRLINGRMRRALDLANIQAEKPGSGAFTTLLGRLKKEYPRLTLYVECVLTDRFAAALTGKFGFTRDPSYSRDRSYYKLPKKGR